MLYYLDIGPRLTCYRSSTTPFDGTKSKGVAVFKGYWS